MSRMMKNLAVAFLLATIALAPSEPALGQDHSRLDAERIGTAAATKATTTDDGVVRIAWARNDVPVKVDGMPLKPFAGLGSWAAFTKAPHGAMVMSDTVVFADEVSPAMDAAFANGLEVTALHNHFFYDEPKVYFMHIGGQGDPEKLAAAVKQVWDAIKRVRSERAHPPTASAGTCRGKAPSILRQSSGLSGTRRRCRTVLRRSPSVARAACIAPRSVVQWALRPGPRSPAAVS